MTTVWHYHSFLFLLVLLLIVVAVVAVAVSVAVNAVIVVVVVLAGVVSDPLLLMLCWSLLGAAAEMSSLLALLVLLLFSFLLLLSWKPAFRGRLEFQLIYAQGLSEMAPRGAGLGHACPSRNTARLQVAVRSCFGPLLLLSAGAASERRLTHMVCRRELNF